MDYPKIYIKKSREKALKNRHSWIFSGAIATKSKMNEGDIVEIRRSDGQLAAYAFFVNGQSIVAKIFEHTQKPLNLDHNYWKNKIFQAANLRKLLKNTTAFRLVFAEGDFFPGLIIDIYNQIAVIQTYHLGIDNIFDYIIQALNELGYRHIFVKKTPEKSKIPTGWHTKPYTDQIIINENGLKFYVDIVQGQKTGFYIDQRDNRKLIELYAKDRTVLNLFSYTGGVSLYALRAGARSVDSVDMSEKALELAQKNVELNQLDSSKHKVFAQNCFDFLDNMPTGYYDLIVIDPPAFAKSQNTVPNAAKGYKELNLKAFRKIKSRGIIFTFSCSQRIVPELFRKIIFEAAADSGRNVRILHQLSQGIDHPVNIYHPESQYLKGLVLYVE